MEQTIGELLPHAVGVALSPFPIVAAILLLTAGKGSNSLMFLLGWFAGLFGVAFVVVALEGLFADPDGGASTTSGVIELVFGLMFLVFAVYSCEYEGVIDRMILEHGRDIAISMFHYDEVNEEAILFVNWAYIALHNAIVRHRDIIAGSSLSWLLQLPYSVEILASTETNGEILTECSCTCVNYKDFETKKIRRSFTCQFHPELLSDLREIGQRPEPSYAELKQSDGIRLLVRLLSEGMQE